MKEFKKVMAFIGMCVSLLVGVWLGGAGIIWLAGWFIYWVTTWPWPTF